MRVYNRGLDVLGGDDYTAMPFNIANAQRNMNDLKPVTLEIARILLRGGQDAIAQANSGAKQPWYKSDLPGQGARDTVVGKLRWHADALAKAKGDPQTTAYASGDDLKKWVMQAYVEDNAVAEGSAALQKSWDAMWAEIRTKLAAIPREAAKAIVSTAGSVVESVTGVPLWVWGIGAAGALGVGGYVYYRLMRRRW